MRLILGIVLGILLVVAGAAIMVFTGSYNVAASTPPGKLEQAVARIALDRSIAKRAPEGKSPVTASPEVLRQGLAHYRENCVGCHGAPGVDAAEYGEGLNPPAPDLSLPRIQKRPDGELYWIVSNGIRMTGMPAFSPTHKEEEIWQIVAFVRHLPEMSPDEEKALRASTESSEHHHEGEEPKASGEKDSPSGSAPTPTPHTHAPGAPPHTHG
jgi:mono/diheme cytochrome c family protein